MLDRFYYQNNKGETLTFGSNGLYANYNDLRNYEWSYDSSDDVISNFKRGITQKTIPAIFCGRYGQECRQARNKAFEVVESDVIAGTKGKLYIGDWYLNCWIYGITNSDYLISERVIYSDFKIVTDDPVWRCEETLAFKRDDSTMDGGVDFAFDFPFDFQRSVFAEDNIENDNVFGAEFKLTLYGESYSPSLNIGGHTYQMDCDIPAGERIEIDSENKTIIKVGVDGSRLNYFGKRYKPESIFEKIPYGHQRLAWTGEFDFELVLIGIRSEPIWTWTEGVPATDVVDVVVVDNRLYLLDSNNKFITDSAGDYITVGLPEV